MWCDMLKLCSPAEQQAAIAATASSAVSFRLLMKMPTLFTRCSVSSVGRCWPALLGPPACHVATQAACQFTNPSKNNHCGVCTVLWTEFRLDPGWTRSSSTISSSAFCQISRPDPLHRQGHDEADLRCFARRKVGLQRRKIDADLQRVQLAPHRVLDLEAGGQGSAVRRDSFYTTSMDMQARSR